MFDNNMFEKWLDQQAVKIVEKMGEGISLTSEDMNVLVLKAQSSHFYHLDTDLRNDMKTLREDINHRFEDVNKRFEDVNRRFNMMFVFMTCGFTLLTVLISVYKFIQ